MESLESKRINFKDIGRELIFINKVCSENAIVNLRIMYFFRRLGIQLTDDFTPHKYTVVL